MLFAELYQFTLYFSRHDITGLETNFGVSQSRMFRLPATRVALSTVRSTQGNKVVCFCMSVIVRSSSLGKGTITKMFYLDLKRDNSQL